jgi:hypothetical protein
VYVTGGSTGSWNVDDYATVAYDAASAERVWVRRYNGPADSVDIATALALSPDGTMVYVTGESAGSGSGFDYATAAYSAS